MTKTFAKLNGDYVEEIVTFVDNKTIDDCLSFLTNYSNGHTNWQEVDPSIVQSGFSWDEVRNKFVPPKHFSSWVLNELNNSWESPVMYPQDGKKYAWDEPTTSWVEFT